MAPPDELPDPPAPAPSGRRPRGQRRGLPVWERSVRWAAGIVAVLVLALLAGLVTAVVVVRSPWPTTTGELALPGLQAEVRVVRDDAGIPQVYADTMHDLMMAQGFVHAQDRFFDMDVRRHATAGRLAELFGEEALESDLVVRTLGWREVAERELLLLRPATRSALDAYAEGVNAYLAGRSTSDIALEYVLLDLAGLDYSPAEWTAVDSIAWLKAMAWDLRGNLDDEIDRALSIEAVGAERADDLFPSYPFTEHAPVVRQGALRGGVFDQDAGPAAGSLAASSAALAQGEAEKAAAALSSVREVVAAAPALLGTGDGIGSNAFVVSGERTASGAPILANDPHLGVSLPGVWSQIGLHCRAVTPECPLDVAGFGFAGVPGVVIGHNRDIAWGFTNLGPDVTDLYLERVEGDRYEYDGDLRPLVLREERIVVRDGEPVTFTVRATRHGPLLSDVADVVAGLAERGDDVELTDDGLVEQVDGLGGPDGLGVSLAWTALEPRPTADALLALDAATDWESFRAALADFAVPGQNVVYADTAGHIGYQATGVVPVRRRGHDGTVPAPGWLRSTDWTGETVPFDALPRVLDPAGGMVVTANQAVIDPRRYPPFLTGDWDRGYRSQRIHDLLAGEASLDVDDLAAIQLDDASAIAEVLTPYLLDVELPDGYLAAGQQLLRDWDHRMDADSGAAAYFSAVWRELLERTFADELPEAIAPDGSDRWFAVVESLLPSASDRWWDDVGTDGVVERRDDVLEAALRAARDDLTARLSPDADEWSWGDLHRLELRSATLGESGIGFVEWLFNRGGWRAAGGGSIVNATGWDARDGYEVVTAPSMRMVVSMDDLDASRWINLTGVSGHAFHPHYTDQTDLWARGEMLPWVFSEDAVEGRRDDVLTLLPAP